MGLPYQYRHQYQNGIKIAGFISFKEEEQQRHPQSRRKKVSLGIYCEDLGNPREYRETNYGSKEAAQPYGALLLLSLPPLAFCSSNGYQILRFLLSISLSFPFFIWYMCVCMCVCAFKDKKYVKIVPLFYVFVWLLRKPREIQNGWN